MVRPRPAGRAGGRCAPVWPRAIATRQRTRPCAPPARPRRPPAPAPRLPGGILTLAFACPRLTARARAPAGHTHGDDNTHLDNRQWAKLCRDAGIISKASPFTSTDADILFAKVKPSPSARRIGFDEFLVALRDVGAKMFDDVPDEDARFRAVERLVVATGGPAKGRVTEADDVRFYDRIGDDERARREKLEARERRRGEAEGGDATLLRAETFRRSSAAANRARGDPLRAAFLNFAHGYGHDAAARTADMDINRFIRSALRCGDEQP